MMHFNYDEHTQPPSATFSHLQPHQQLNSTHSINNAHTHYLPISNHCYNSTTTIWHTTDTKYQPLTTNTTKTSLTVRTWTRSATQTAAHSCNLPNPDTLHTHPRHCSPVPSISPFSLSTHSPDTKQARQISIKFTQDVLHATLDFRYSRSPQTQYCK